MLRFRVAAASQAQLKRLSRPQSTQGGENQGIAWSYFDTATYVSAATTQLTFFTTARATRQLSNLDTPGSLAEPKYFKIFAFQLDPLVAAGAATVMRDMGRILTGTGTAGQGGPTFQFNLADKIYGPWPLTLLHSTGGPLGNGYSTVAATTDAYANNSHPDGGYWQDGAICIPPSQDFSATITWPAAVTLAADIDIRVVMSGTLYRAIV